MCIHKHPGMPGYKKYNRLRLSSILVPATCQIARNMNELTQGRSRTLAGIVKSPLVSSQTARNMNELTQERSRTPAGIAKSPLVSPHPARDTKGDMQEPAL